MPQTQDDVVLSAVVEHPGLTKAELAFKVADTEAFCDVDVVERLDPLVYQVLTRLKGEGKVVASGPPRRRVWNAVTET